MGSSASSAATFPVSRYPVDVTFSCEIPEATLVGSSGAVSTREGEVLAQSSSVPVAEMVVPDARRATPVWPGRYVSLLAWPMNNYTHWLMDCLPRLALVDVADASLRVIVPAESTGYQRDSLNLLGVSDVRVRPMREHAVTVETLVLCHAARRLGVPHAVHFQQVRDSLWSAARARPPASPNRRIYISRARSRRRLVNEATLEPALREFGFGTVFCEELSLIDQIHLFSQANVVLGAHGAGVVNHVFCAPGATAIEIYNPVRWDHAAWHRQPYGTHPLGRLRAKREPPVGDVARPQEARKALEYARETLAQGDRARDALHDDPY